MPHETADTPDGRRAAMTARLREAAAAKGISQNKLARELGERGLPTAASTVNGWMKRGSMPGGEYLMVLPSILGVSGHWLLTGDGPREPASCSDSVTSQIVAEVVAFAHDLEERYSGHGRTSEAAPSTTEPSQIQAALNLLEAVREAEELLRPSPPAGARRRARG